MNENGTSKAKTLGSLFAGIGGFDLGFERAGWKTAWQVEINPVNRAVLADRFPHAAQFEEVATCGKENLSKVDCITAGFPCQDFSIGGNSRKDKSERGLTGSRSSLFFEVVRIAREIQPTWMVLENVPSMLTSNDGRDFETILRSLAECGYLGFWRVLDAQYFGVPQRRQRIFLVCGLGRYPSLEFLVDAAPVESIPTSIGALPIPRPETSFAGYTLSATNSSGRIQIGCEVLVAEADGWHQMVERRRKSRLHGIPKGRMELELCQSFAAGNAVVPAIAEWIARLLNRS